MMSTDQSKPVLLVLLDLSAAFVSGTTLPSVRGILSDILFLLSGVPQGLGLCTPAFTMYTCPVRVIAQRYGVNYHLYDDDTQLDTFLDADNRLNVFSSLKNLEHCIADIRLWVIRNLLRLNNNKTNITSRIYIYCNSLLYGISDYSINRLQRIQNSSACIVTNTRKYDHITPILQNLHWLPVSRELVYREGQLPN